jgi:hypothetical protein
MEERMLVAKTRLEELTPKTLPHPPTIYLA